jgi:hypothetical protein
MAVRLRQPPEGYFSIRIFAANIDFTTIGTAI